MLNQMKIPVRLVLLGGFPMAALVLVLLLSFQLSNQKDLLFDRLYQHHILALNDLLLIQRLTQKTALDAIRLYRTGWAATGTTIDAVSQSLEEAKAVWHAYQTQRTQGESDLNQRADQQFEQVVTLYQQWLQPAGSDALHILILNDSTFNMETDQSLGSFDQSLNTLIQNQLDAASAVQLEASALTRLLLRAYIYGGGLLIIGSVLLAWRIQHSIQQPLHALRNLILEVAHSSNLTLQARPLGNDEVAQAATALNQLLDHFQGLVQKLESNAHSLRGHAGQALQEIRASVQEITRLNTDIFTATGQQRVTVGHNLDAIQTLNQSTLQLDHDAGESLHISQELAGIAATLSAGIQQFKV